MIFSSLDLAPELQKGVKACGFHDMTPIQEKAIIPARRGKDILACAQTGTGKTAAFAIPVLQQMLDNPKACHPNAPRALILSPTRELAEQLANTISELAQFLPFKITAFYGGVKMGGQENKLKAGVDILVSTPGRLLEHMTQCNINLANVEYVVLDEADRMLDMGFIADVTALLKHTAKKHQTLLFSATISQSVNELAHKILKNPVEIHLAKQSTTADTVEHFMYAVDEEQKLPLFMALLEEENWFQVLVFTSTKLQADTLLANLKKVNVHAAICHGDKSQGARRRALADFKNGDIQVLIATEVAARGIDIQGLEYVINFNLPFLAEDYVHRIGRTGRAGQKGRAISFVSREEERSLKAIERLIGSTIKRLKKKGYDAQPREISERLIAEKSKPVKPAAKSAHSKAATKKSSNSKKTTQEHSSARKKSR